MKRVPFFLEMIFPQIKWKSDLEKTIFTFDDGPDEQWSLKFSKLLKKYGESAIFFLVGKNIRDESVLTELQKDGHELAWHSYSHHSFWRLSKAEIEFEINSYKDLENRIQQKIRYFRFPYGHFLPNHIKLVIEKNLEIMMWSYMLSDYKDISPQRLLRSLGQLKKDDILLYHDSSPNVENSYRALEEYFEKRIDR